MRFAFFLAGMMAVSPAWGQGSGVGKSTAETLQKESEASRVETPVRSVPDPGTVTTNQTITPAGLQSVFESKVYGISFGATSDEVYAATAARGGSLVYRMDWRANRVIDKMTAAGGPGMQSMTYDPAGKAALLTIVGKGGVQLVRNWSAGTGVSLGKSATGGAALSPVGAPGVRVAVVPLTFNDEAAVVDLASGAVLRKVRTGIAPFGAVVDGANATAFVTNWGGRFPADKDRTARTGEDLNADRIVVDERGVAASGTVTRIDLKTGAVLAQIEVGLHPTGLAIDDARHMLYVTNSNSDTVSVIDTARNAVVETIAVEPFAVNVAGVAPESLVLSKDGRHLYVACAGINAIAVIAVGSGAGRIEGMIPTGWYPDDLALSPDGQYLGVSTLLGVGSGWKNAPLDMEPKGGRSIRRRYVHSYRGTIHVIGLPTASQLADYTHAVAANNHLRLKDEKDVAEAVGKAGPQPVPMRAGDPSPIKHIVYLIKENRSYDQFFGDLGKGNGDPTLAVYGEDVIPNHRRLAREYVLLDNFYATGGNSADGHQWVTQASETDYTYWPGYGGRSYPYAGEDPMADARGGFLWNGAANGHKSFIDFGEYAGNGAGWQAGVPKPYKSRAELLEDFKKGSDFAGMFSAKAAIASLNPFLAKDYPGWSLGVPDVARARVFISQLHEWEAKGEMPNLVMGQLPSDHTGGTSPGFSTPRACIADNDYAVGMIVDAISHSKFWDSTLILIVEDDAQAGLDHVDGHRTIALAVSPWIKRGAVDSTFYSQTSMVKTIELILGLKTMSLFDLIANDMRASFTATPDATPYSAVEPGYSIYTLNPPLKSLNGQAKTDAVASTKMNFRIPDAAPTERLNRILWRDVRGTTAFYPEAKKAVFAPYALDLDDDEKDEMNRKKDKDDKD